jgi:hypothetical protein
MALAPQGIAQPSGEEVAKRLKEGVDNPEANQNKYRGGVGSIQEVIQNMKQIGSTIWRDFPDQSLDKWYSPHLRDSKFVAEGLAQEQAQLRAHAGVALKGPCKLPGPEGQFWCASGLGLVMTACPQCQMPKCGNIPWPHKEHLEEACCNPTGAGTAIYLKLVNDSNFKTCCVRDGTSDNPLDKTDETRWTEEKIACTHRAGDGWAGLFEYYYPTTIIGLENQRAETMIATKEEVNKCIGEADKLMESQQAVDWVAEAIERNMKATDGGSGGASSGIAADMAKIKQQIAEDIKKVRPKDTKLRFSDSVQGRGLTARPFLPAYDRAAMSRLARHFCMRDEQFHKLMDDRPKRDLLQLRGYGGRSPEELAKIPLWANYCQEGVELMTKTGNSSLRNVDQTDTNFAKGMAKWQENPLYCQLMHSSHEDMRASGIDEVVRKGSKGQRPVTAAEAGYTCLESELNGGMVPVSLYRQVPIERRTAIADHMLGFLIAGGLFPQKWQQPGIVPGSTLSMYKRFEPQPYSMTAAPGYQTFWGNSFKGGATNELLQPCRGVSGENYNQSELTGKTGNSDQLFLSDYTHKSFTQKPIVNVNGERKQFDRAMDDWAKNPKEDPRKIDDRGLDKDAHTYGVAFRIFATCPAGYSRWRPLSPHGALSINLETHCGEENFGSPRAHVPRGP